MNDPIGHNKLYKVANPLPQIPEKADKQTVKAILEQFAANNNFTIVINKADKNRLHFKCIKGEKYKDSRKLGDLERQKLAFTARNECPYLLRLSNLKNGGYKLRPARSEEETFHNHPLDEINLLSTHKGRYSNLEFEEIKTISIGIDQNSKARDIQKSISIGNRYNKVTVHDVNNLKYLAKKPEAVSKASETEANRLIETMESKNFVAAYQFNAAKFLDSVFFTNKAMIKRTKQFPEVVIIDATYGTNNLKMPLISAYGVSNLGGIRLATFPTAYAWVSDEKEPTYKWFLQTLNDVFSGVLENAVFVTDKCQALTNQLDRVFEKNSKILCRWHLANNLDDRCKPTVFRDTEARDKFKQLVFDLMNCTKYVDHMSILKQIDKKNGGP